MKIPRVKRTLEEITGGVCHLPIFPIFIHHCGHVTPVIVERIPVIKIDRRRRRHRRTGENLAKSVNWWLKRCERIIDDPHIFTLPCYGFELSGDAPVAAKELVRYSGIGESYMEAA